MSVRRPSDSSNHLLFNPLEDPHFADTIQDFLTIFSSQELEQKPYLQAYLVELLARWGRWLSRGRAPALCFEAACVGGFFFLKKTGREPCELTARSDAALARLLAGMVIDKVEPMARKQGGPAREKAIGIVADEFLAKTASSNPDVATSAKKRMKKRRTVIKMSPSEDLLGNNEGGVPPSLSSEASYSPSHAVGMDRRPSLGGGANMEPIHESNSYYSVPFRERQSSNDSSYSESYDRSAAPYQPYQQQPLPQRYPAGSQRLRQASIPLYSNSNQGDFDQQTRARQASEGGNYDNRPIQYFSDSKFVAGQKGRKTSLEGIPSSLVGSSSSEYIQAGRPRKNSADSNVRGNFQGGQIYHNQQQPPVNPSYGSEIQSLYRNNSLNDPESVQFRARTESVDRGLNASRYDGDRRTSHGNSRQQSIPSTTAGLGGNRRPSQQTKPQQHFRTRYGDDPPLERQPMNQRSSPSSIQNRPGNNLAHSSSRQQQEQQHGAGDPVRNQYRGDPVRHPDSFDIQKRRPSNEEVNPGYSSRGGGFRQAEERGPVRSRTPTLDYGAPKPGQQITNDQLYSPAHGSNRAKPQNTSSGKQVDDLENYLKTVYFDDQKPT